MWIYEALTRTGASDRTLAAFADCGGNLWLATRDDEPTLVSNRCRNRHCQTCALRRRASLVAAVEKRIAEAADRCRFVTLTLRCQQVPLIDQLARLTASFRRLRQRKWWMSKVTGGAVFIELKLGENSGAWHVHAHCIVEGEFIDQVQLAQEWHRVTGDSFIVDVRAIAENAKIASYVAKYATKPLHQNVIRSPKHLDECIIAVKGKRLLDTFGTWDGFGELDDDPKGKPVMIGRIDDLFDSAAAGDPQARRWVAVCLERWPSLSRFFQTQRIRRPRPPA